MKITSVLCTALLIAVNHVTAAQRLSLKDITAGEFRQEVMSAVEPLSDGETYAQISENGQQIVQFSFKTGKQVGVLFDAAKARGPKIGRIDDYIISPDGKRILIQTNTKAVYRRSFTATYYIYVIQNNKLEPLSDGGPQQTPVWSPDGNQVAFVRDNNIWLVKLLYGNAESQVTKDGKFGEVINGIPDWVYEEEFSTNSSMVFTADSRQIVWIRYDESQVKQFSLQMFKGLAPSRDEYAEYPGEYRYKYPLPGGENSRVSVMSYDIQSHQTRTLQVPLEADGYIPRLKPTSDASKVVVLTLNRHQDNLKAYIVNPLSTIAQLVIDEHVDKYIKDDVLESFLITTRHLVLTSERNGFNNIFVYTLNGQQQRQVSGVIVTDVYGLDESTGDLYFAAKPNGPLDQQVMVSRQNGKIEPISEPEGVSRAIFSRNFKYFINVWSDINHPSVYSLRQNNGKILATMIDNKSLTEKLSHYNLGTKEFFQFTTSEGIQLNGWLLKPAGFDASKRYPVIMYQYGGPGSQQVLNQWGIGMNGNGAILEQLLAQEGFLVVCVDGRGTGGRGAEFEKCTYMHLGELEACDQVESAIWLGQQTYVDKERIGIWGWSYGGWNTLMSMSEGRPVFRCGIAIAPPTSWRFYDTVYTERYMRTPKENEAGYEINPINRAFKLNGSLLLCHGLADDNVHYQNTAEYTEALVQADKDFRQLVYTNRNHSIFGGNTRNHLFRQCLNFFKAELQ